MRLWGNRCFAAGLALCAIGIQQYTTTDGIQEILGYAAMQSGISLTTITTCGRSTPAHYKRTMEHIKENGGVLDRRFAETLIKQSENGRCIGYCQQQGLYLAARNTGQLEVFEKAKKAKSNIIIPHF